MKNSKLRRVLLLLACAVLLVSLSVGATLAYLTSTTATVTNTFSVGNVQITLDEAPVDAKGDATTGTRVTNNTYKLLPGHEYDKDPTVHVGELSEDCWLFVKITNDIAAIEADVVIYEEQTDDNGDITLEPVKLGTIADQMADNGWTAVDGETGVYAYEAIVSKDDDVVVFTNFQIKGDVINDALAAYEGKTITVQAYAVQADGFTTSDAAWEAAPLAAWQTPVVENP